MQSIQKECRRHGVQVYVKAGSSGYYRCRKCRSANVTESRRRMKRRLVEAAGGQCVICGYNRYYGSLEFHHVDPATKTLKLGGAVAYSLARGLEEIKKCVLLCGNCHPEVEAGVTELPSLH